MLPSRITSYRSFGRNCEAPSEFQILPRFLSRLKSQVSSRHFYEGQCKAPDVVAREINHVEGLGASPARKAHYPPLVRKLPNLPPRVGGASFALGMMLSHPAKSCDTTVLSCLSFQSHAFLLSRKYCRYMIDSPLGFFWNLSNPTFLSSSPAEKSHQYTQTIQAPTLLRVNIFQISWTVT